MTALTDALTDALDRIEGTTDTGDFGAGMLNAAGIIRDALGPIVPPHATVIRTPDQLQVVFVPDDAQAVSITRYLLLEILESRAKEMGLTLTVVSGA